MKQSSLGVLLICLASTVAVVIAIEGGYRRLSSQETRRTTTWRRRDNYFTVTKRLPPGRRRRCNEQTPQLLPHGVKYGGYQPPPQDGMNPTFHTHTFSYGYFTDSEERNTPIFAPQQNFAFSPQASFNNMSMESRLKIWWTNWLYFYQGNPTLGASVVACIGIFLAWQTNIRPIHKLLRQWFLASRQNVRAGRLPSLFLSAFSHNGFFHLLVNLVTFMSFGPKVRQRINWPLWPLMLGASLSGSLTFMLRNPHGQCMGLSAVTLALVAVHCKLYPTSVLRFLVAGVLPVSMQAHHFLLFTLGGSAVGTLLLQTRSRVAHAAHLGGLLFGLAYYEVWLRRLQFRSSLGKKFSF